MRYINISNLKETFDRLNGTGSFSEWERSAKEHLRNIESKPSKKKRENYFSRYNIWTILYPALSELSGDKCWYTESKENSSEWQIDHFRPKAKSLDVEGDVILENGYWWLSYDWKNFRLSGTLVNYLRKGRFKEGDEVKGKGNYFPLKDKTKAAIPKDMLCDTERPLLLDPTKANDIKLISFDEDGMAYETYNEMDDSYKQLRASVSIKCYGLQHKPLIRGRARVWSSCDEIVEKTQNDLMLHKDVDDLVDDAIAGCYEQLAYLADKKSPHSIVVFNYIKTKSVEDDYKWLNAASTAIV